MEVFALCLITTMAYALVDDQAAVKTSLRDLGQGRYVLSLEVAPEDAGKVIGKKGRTARAMRTVLGAFNMREGVNITLNIIEDQKAEARV
jgi:predicted RNA-binding protein YlqC (UPF0109 family)